MGKCGKDPEWSGEWGTPELRDWGYGKSRGFITRRIWGIPGSETQQSYNRNHSVFLVLLTGLAKKLIQVCPSHPTVKAKWPFGQPNTGLPNSVWTSSKAERRSSNEFSHVQGSVLHWEGPKAKADKDLKEWESRVKGEVQRRRKTWGEWTQSQTRWEGRWTVVRALGDFANVLNLDRDRTRNRGASGERLERRGKSAEESRRQQQFYMTTAWRHTQTHHHLKETVATSKGRTQWCLPQSPRNADPVKSALCIHRFHICGQKIFRKGFPWWFSG